MIELREAGVADRAWDAFVAEHPESTLYNLSGWGPVARRAYGIQPFIVVSRAAPGAPIRGGMPLFLVSRLVSRYATSGIFGAYAPVLAESDEVRAEIFAAALRFTEERRAAHIHVKALGEVPTPPGYSRHDIWVTAKLPLAGGAGAVWKRLRKSIRAAVKQAERANLEVRWGRGELGSFYDVLADNMHRKGSPIYGYRFMQEMADVFGDRVEVITLWTDGIPISGAITVEQGGALYVPFASSRAAYFKLRPYDLLYWKILQRACERGLHTFDFGSSMRGSTTLDFKTHFGCVVEPITSLVHTQDGSVPVLAPDNAAIRTVVKTWKAMPRGMADALGPVVSRFIV